jgi:hypothetical protein
LLERAATLQHFLDGWVCCCGRVCSPGCGSCAFAFGLDGELNFEWPAFEEGAIQVQQLGMI